MKMAGSKIISVGMLTLLSIVAAGGARAESTARSGFAEVKSTQGLTATVEQEKRAATGSASSSGTTADATLPAPMRGHNGVRPTRTIEIESRAARVSYFNGRFNWSMSNSATTIRH